MKNNAVRQGSRMKEIPGSAVITLKRIAAKQDAAAFQHYKMENRRGKGK